MMNFPIKPVKGFSLLEAIVALTILIAGVVGIIFMFPQVLGNARHSEMQTRAVFLAQRKAEEIRRDDDVANTLINAIRDSNTPTAPVTFPQDPELAYQFSGQSILYDAASPEGTPGVARVIVRYSPEFRTSSNPDKDVLFELRFAP